MGLDGLGNDLIESDRHRQFIMHREVNSLPKNGNSSFELSQVLALFLLFFGVFRKFFSLITVNISVLTYFVQAMC